MNQQPRILVVDDEPQLARVLRTGLKTHGYDVRVAADGVSALETFGDWHPDLVVTDLAMPNMGGLELCRRLRAQLRRAQTSAAAEAPSAILEDGDFRVDLEARSVSVRGGEVHLTPKEYDLLVYFVRHAGKVLTHGTLLGAVWGGDYTEQGEYLRVFVGQLRKKIEPTPSSPRYILTEPWVGYRFNSEQYAVFGFG